MEALGVKTIRLVEYGSVWRWATYALYEWIDAKTLFFLLPEFSQKKQFEIGIIAGKMLKKIHSIPPMNEGTNLAESMSHIFCTMPYILHKHNIKICEKCEILLEFINANHDLTQSRPISFVHGNFGAKNLMWKNDTLILIDFETLGFGDICADLYIDLIPLDTSPYAIGILHCYFGGSIPSDFWNILALYQSYVSLNALILLKRDYISASDNREYYIRLFESTVHWIKNFATNPIPEWYEREYAKWIK
jgi:aminoglycoside phosphotransferase (APT) family kinase protein